MIFRGGNRIQERACLPPQHSWLTTRSRDAASCLCAGGSAGSEPRNRAWMQFRARCTARNRCVAGSLHGKIVPWTKCVALATSLSHKDARYGRRSVTMTAGWNGTRNSEKAERKSGALPLRSGPRRSRRKRNVYAEQRHLQVNRFRSRQVPVHSRAFRWNSSFSHKRLLTPWDTGWYLRLDQRMSCRDSLLPSA